MALELILNITANMLGAIAIILSTWAFMVSKRDAAYGDLDGIFYDSVLAVGIEKPRFRNPKYTSDYYKFLMMKTRGLPTKLMHSPAWGFAKPLWIEHQKIRPCKKLGCPPLKSNIDSTRTG